jgi:hypothetical protein
VAQGKTPDYAEAARMLGDENAPAAIARMHAENLRAGQQALNAVGVKDTAAFETWLRKHDPDLASTIVRDVVLNHDVTKLQRSGRQYLAARDNAVAQALSARGIETQRIQGKLYVKKRDIGLPYGDFKDDVISVAQAEAEKYLNFNG